ncbi:MAG: response regulator [Bacteroidales bacterium]|nr:response regulator [Bacteroidales bacterium]
MLWFYRKHLKQMEKKYKILIVDDNAKNIQVLANLLAENNYNIEYALSGSGALELLAIESFDLILLDIMMPEMDGFEVCNKIKNDPKSSEIPIIFLTAKTDSDSIQKAFEEGGLDYVNKPFNSNELLARVKTHIELKVSKDKLKIVNKWLEEKVEERTAALKIAHQKLLELDSAKSQFLQIISHEIRTPLNAILGSLSILKEEDIGEDASVFIEMLDNSATRLENFSYKALDISQFHLYGKKVVKLKNTSVLQIIAKVISSLDNERKVKGIQIKLSINTDIDIIPIDVDFFYKAIYNILHNAIKHSPKSATIPFNIHEESDQLIFEILDEGEGFEKGIVIKNITSFESKNHLDSNPGLSLFLSNQIITAHGGSIENGNNLHGGAYVRVLLPVEA